MQSLSVIENLKNLLMLLAAIIFSVILVEFTLGLRFLKGNKSFPPPPPFINKYRASPHLLIDGSILYVGLANMEFLSFGYKFRNNSWGFREKEFAYKKNKKVFRILAFGDSFTFGVGVDNNHRYTNVLEEALKLNNINSEVINFGMGGYSTDQEHDLIKLVLKEVECDLIMIGFCCDDMVMTTLGKLINYTNYSAISAQVRERILSRNKKFDIKGFRNLNTIPTEEPKEFSKTLKWYQETNLFKVIDSRK